MKKLATFVVLFLSVGTAFAQDGVTYLKKQDFWGDRPINMNIVEVSPNSDYEIQLTYGNTDINKLMRVEDFAKEADAYAAMNASYFKQDTGTPLGLSIIDGSLMTGPLLNRSAFGVDKHGNCSIGRVVLEGKITIGDDLTLPIKNINQPIISSGGAHLYNYIWGRCTPCAKGDVWHIGVYKNRIVEVSDTPIEIPEYGYAMIIPKNSSQCPPLERTLVKYCYNLSPENWCKMKYAFAAGPNLVIDGQKNIDGQSQNFGALFMNVKTARSAIGIKKDGAVILVTVDGRQKDVAGVSLSEMADIMLQLGACQAMNLDGGSSTQMVVNQELVNVPTNKKGARVTNAVIVVKKKTHLMF